MTRAGGRMRHSDIRVTEQYYLQVRPKWVEAAGCYSGGT